MPVPELDRCGSVAGERLIVTTIAAAARAHDRKPSIPELGRGQWLQGPAANNNGNPDQAHRSAGSRPPLTPEYQGDLRGEALADQAPGRSRQ